MAYIEDVLCLCRRADSGKSGKNQLHYLFEGLSHDPFSGIASRPPNTVAAFIVECKRYKDLRSGRILQGSFEQLSEVIPSSPRSDLSASVRNVIRSKVQGFMSHPRTLLPDSGI